MKQGHGMSKGLHTIPSGLLCLALLSSVGCAHMKSELCTGPQCEVACGTNGHGCGKHCPRGGLWFRLCGWMCSGAVPDGSPLGSIVPAHYRVTEADGEAADFLIHRHDFIEQTTALTPQGREKVLEIAARMRTAPFPIRIERTENNSNPQLDCVRRNVIAQILTDLGSPDADSRTVFAPADSPGYYAMQAEGSYNQHVISHDVSHGIGGLGATGSFGALGAVFGTERGFWF